ncbi:MAG: rane fusion protein multidrug efflux system [Sphingomonadales bacterium]|jgi:RND family efflux transporter MFP subunit|nr:rane fusion protein multidrug efflux system [Sphingomonadales bacterium]
MDQVKIFLAIAPLALLAACSGGADGNAADNGADNGATAEAPVATVRTAPATLGATSGDVVVYGAAEAGAGNQRGLAVQAEATLTRIVAPTGTAVGAGQVVAILSPSATTRLDVAKAASDAAAARSALARAARLRRDGLVSNGDVETARAAARTAEATLAMTRQRGGTLVLRAPVAGTVQNLTAKLGDLVPAGTTVATLGAQGELRARLGIDPALAARVHPGQPISVSALNGSISLMTTVVGVDPQVDATTRLASVYARLPAGSGFGAGEPLRAAITTTATTSGITIPYRALLDDGGRSFVFVVKDGVAHQRDVTPGNSMGDRIQILRGLQPNERVVTEGGTALEDGMKVVEEGARPASAAR